MFVTPISMNCTAEQYEKDLRPRLLELGYVELSITNWERFPTLCTNWNGINYFLGNFRKDNNRYFIDHYNPQLFLALASMTNDVEHKIEEFRKPTKEEIINHFTKKEEMTGNKFPFKLTTEQGKRIINIACSDWKEILANKWGKDFILNGYTYISEDYYKEMRSACTDKQHQVFDEIFGSDVPKYKIGDYIYILNLRSTVTGPLTDTNKKHIGARVGDIVQIENITYKDGSATKRDPRYYGVNFNLRAKDFRLATPEEIEKAKCPYKNGEMIFVRDVETDGWRILPSTGKFVNGFCETYSTLEKDSKKCYTWNQHLALPKDFKLPK